MNAKQQKKLYLTIALALFGAGVLCLILMDKFSSCGFFSFVLIGGSLIFLGKYATINYKLNLIELDKKLKNKIKDYENNAEQLPYNEVIDEDKRVEILQTYIKKNKKSYISFYLLATVFIIISLFLLFN